MPAAYGSTVVTPPATGRTGPQPLWRQIAGDAVRERRRTLGLRLRDVAERAGISPQYLSEVERGRKEPSSEMLASICGALGLPLLDLLRAAGRRLHGGDGRVRPALPTEPPESTVPTTPPAPAGPAPAQPAGPAPVDQIALILRTAPSDRTTLISRPATDLRPPAVLRPASPSPAPGTAQGRLLAA